MRGSKRWSGLLAACLSLSMVAMACGDDGGAATDDSSNGASSADVQAAQADTEEALAVPAAIAQTEPLAGPVPDEGSIIFVSNGLPATKNVALGIEQATKEIGWDFEVIYFDPADPSTLQSALRSALAKKPTYVAETGTSQDQIGDDVLGEFEKAGIPLILTSVSPFHGSEYMLGNPDGPAQQREHGRVLANWFVADSDGKGKALLGNVTAFPVLVDFADGFVDQVESICPDCEVDIVELTADQIASNQIVPTMVSKLRSSSGFEYLLFDNGEFAVGIDAALQAAGLEDTKVGGRSIDANAATALEEGKQAAWTGTSYPAVGYAIVDIALRHATESEGMSGNDTAAIQLLTPENVDDYTDPYVVPTDALEQYVELWGL